MPLLLWKLLCKKHAASRILPWPLTCFCLPAQVLQRFFLLELYSQSCLHGPLNPSNRGLLTIQNNSAWAKPTHSLTHSVPQSVSQSVSHGGAQREQNTLCTMTWPFLLQHASSTVWAFKNSRVVILMYSVINPDKNPQLQNVIKFLIRSLV